MSRCPGGILVENAVGQYPQGFSLGPISFQAKEGEIVVVVGPNASGKTTLLRLISGILPLVNGRVVLCSLERDRFLSRRPSQLSYVPSFPEADLMATPEEIIEASSGSVEVALRYIPIVKDFIGRRLLYLSSGQRRLACIARGFSTNPKLLLIDEPLAHLDVSMQELVLNSIKALAREGATVIITMHELYLASLVADRILLIKNGRVVRFGRPEEVLEREVLEKVYEVKLLEIKMGKRSIYLPRVFLA